MQRTYNPAEGAQTHNTDVCLSLWETPKTPLQTWLVAAHAQKAHVTNTWKDKGKNWIAQTAVCNLFYFINQKETWTTETQESCKTDNLIKGCSVLMAAARTGVNVGPRVWSRM